MRPNLLKQNLPGMGFREAMEPLFRGETAQAPHWSMGAPILITRFFSRASLAFGATIGYTLRQPKATRKQFTNYFKDLDPMGLQSIASFLSFHYTTQMNRRLIVCCDGTWQDLFQGYPTNVVKTAQAIMPTGDDGCDQIVFYEEGVGTGQMNSKGSIVDWLTKLGGGGLGLGIDNKIQAAYRFLCLNYKDGDEIYLFGFSRGAYTVRCLAGLIYNSGLPRCKFVRKIPEAYELYRDRSLDTAPKGPAAVNFRNTYGDRVPIKALCCWDTVASMGLPDLLPGIDLEAKFNKRYAFHDTKINHTIEHAFHAVATDENRKVFYHTPMTSDVPGQLSQVWFPGGHGSVGGGRIEERGLSDGALQWMLDNVKALHLTLDENNVEYGKEGSEMKYGVRPMPKAPFRIAKSQLGAKPRELPCDCSIDNLHISVKERWKDPQCNYKPENLRHVCGEALDAWCG